MNCAGGLCKGGKHKPKLEDYESPRKEAILWILSHPSARALKESEELKERKEGEFILAASKYIRDLEVFQTESWLQIPKNSTFREAFYRSYSLVADYSSHQAQLLQASKKVHFCETETSNASQFRPKTLKLVLCPEATSTIRELGLPLSRYSSFLRASFHIETQKTLDLEYQASLNCIFKGKIPDDFIRVPSFSTSPSSMEVINQYPFDPSHRLSVMRVLWLVYFTSSKLRTCPFLPSLACSLSFFLTESELFKVLTLLIDDSHSLQTQKKNGLPGFHWHLFLGSWDLLKLGSLLARKKAKIPPEESEIEKMEELFRDFLLLGKKGSPNWVLSFRLLLLFLNEGLIAVFRVLWVLTESRKVERVEEMGLEEMEETIKKSFSVKIPKETKESQAISQGNPKEPVRFFYPIPDRASRIIDLEVFQMIFDGVPTKDQNSNPFLLFASYEHGYSLQSLLSKTQEKQGKFYLILIRSKTGEVFGAGLDCQIAKPANLPQFRGGLESFVFRLVSKEPRNIELSKATGRNMEIFEATNDGIIIGLCENGSALQIDSDLLKGSTKACATFGNKPLNGKESLGEEGFEVETVEVYQLKSSS